LAAVAGVGIMNQQRVLQVSGHSVPVVSVSVVGQFEF
jgi:hypothetical protein